MSQSVFGHASRQAIARRIPIRAMAVIGLVLLAYNYSLMTLARGLSLQTPLAYLALVPAIALCLAAVRQYTRPEESPIQDRQLDWIVGLGFLAATGAILVLAPRPESSGFWLARIDLLTLPLFVAGLVSLLYGVRSVWALRLPILFLLLAWPIPFTLVLSATSGVLTELTAKIVAVLTRIIPVARPAVGDETLLLVGSGPDIFGVNIGSACSGVNSFVGFLLLGAATLYLVRGSAARRVAWLATGLVLTLSLNITRIMAILAVGRAFGQDAALDVLHPIAGLIVFNLGVLIMLVLAPRFGLRLIGRSDRARSTDEARPHPVPQLRSAFVVALAIAVVFGVTNAAYARYESISSGLADARMQSFDIRGAHVPGWETTYIASIAQGRQYFGDTSTWDRVVYRPTDAAEITSTKSVYVDVMTTGDPGTFAAYGLDACYTFHGYNIASVSRVDVGAGVSAQVIDYTNTKSHIEWSALWWEWPYQAEDGETRYQRIVIFMADGPKATFGGLADSRIATQDPRFVETDQFLATLGMTIVRSQFSTASS